MSGHHRQCNDPEDDCHHVCTLRESHYPSSAELSALRRGIADQVAPGFFTYTPGPFGPDQLGDKPWYDSPPNGTEKRWGIPASYDRSGDSRRARARREASQMRSEAFATLDFEAGIGGLSPAEWEYWSVALELFAPEP